MYKANQKHTHGMEGVTGMNIERQGEHIRRSDSDFGLSSFLFLFLLSCHPQITGIIAIA